MKSMVKSNREVLGHTVTKPGYGCPRLCVLTPSPDTNLLLRVKWGSTRGHGGWRGGGTAKTRISEVKRDQKQMRKQHNYSS